MTSLVKSVPLHDEIMRKLSQGVKRRLVVTWRCCYQGHVTASLVLRGLSPMIIFSNHVIVELEMILDIAYLGIEEVMYTWFVERTSSAMFVMYVSYSLRPLSQRLGRNTRVPGTTVWSGISGWLDAFPWLAITFCVFLWLGAWNVFCAVGEVVSNL